MPWLTLRLSRCKPIDRLPLFNWFADPDWILLFAGPLGRSDLSSDYLVIAVRSLFTALPEGLTFAGFLEQDPPTTTTPSLFLLTAHFRKNQLVSVAHVTHLNIFVFPNQTFTSWDWTVQTKLPTNVTASCTKVTGLKVTDIEDALSNADQSIAATVVLQELEKLDFSVRKPFAPNVWNGTFVSVVLILLMYWAMATFLAIDVQSRFTKKHRQTSAICIL
jgi:hypothetical protein